MLSLQPPAPKALVWGDGMKSAALTAHTACVREGIRRLFGIYGEEAMEVLKERDQRRRQKGGSCLVV